MLSIKALMICHFSKENNFSSTRIHTNDTTGHMFLKWGNLVFRMLLHFWFLAYLMGFIYEMTCDSSQLKSFRTSFVWSLLWFHSTWKWKKFKYVSVWFKVVDSTTIWMRENFFFKMKQNKWLESSLIRLEILPSTCQLFAWWISNTNLYQLILQ